VTFIEEYYKINKELRGLLEQAREEQDESGEVGESTRERIFEYAKNRDDFLTDVAVFYKQMDARHAGLKAEFKPIQDRMKADLDRLDKTKEFCKWLVTRLTPNPEKYYLVNEKIYMYYTPSERVVIQDADQIPECYTERTPMPAAIKADLKMGAKIPGARIEKNFNLRISEGGEAAKVKNQKRIKNRRSNEED
jgi:hypothetical protein